MITVGIDQSLTSTGITIFDDGELKDCFIIKSNKEDSDEERIVSIWEGIEEIVIEADNVFLEGLSYGSNSTSARPLAGLYYYILIKLSERGVEYTSFPPTSIKKFALKGNAKKWDMFLEINENDKEILLSKGYKKTTGLLDMSDAYWINKFGNSFLTK